MPDPQDGNEDDEGAGGDEHPFDRREPRVPDFVKEELLEHELRRAIYDLLEDKPGTNKSQLCEELGITWNQLSHHLDKLCDNHLVATRKGSNGNQVHCFRVEDLPLWTVEATRVLYGRNESRTVALFLVENPGASTGEIADALGLTRDGIRHHIKRLRVHDLVLRHPAGDTFLYEASTLLDEWANSVGSHFDRDWPG